MVGVDVCTHMLFQVDLHDLTESALVTASLHVASLSLLGRFFEDLDKKGLIFFFRKRTKRMIFICQNAPSSSLVGCCNISSWTGFVDFLAFLNLDFLSYIFSVSENTKIIHLIMMIWLFSFIISSYKLASSPPKDPGGSKKILSKSRI